MLPLYPLGQRVDVPLGALPSACPPVTVHILRPLGVFAAFLLFICDFLCLSRQLRPPLVKPTVHQQPYKGESGRRADGNKETQEPGLPVLTHKPEEWVLRVKMLGSSAGIPAPGRLAARMGNAKEPERP